MSRDVHTRKVLATFPLHRAGVRALAGRAELHVAAHEMRKEQELEPFLSGVDALIVGATPPRLHRKSGRVA
jgi:hypothetical protein